MILNRDCQKKGILAESLKLRMSMIGSWKVPESSWDPQIVSPRQETFLQTRLKKKFHRSIIFLEILRNFSLRNNFHISFWYFEKHYFWRVQKFLCIWILYVLKHESPKTILLWFTTIEKSRFGDFGSGTSHTHPKNFQELWFQKSEFLGSPDNFLGDETVFLVWSKTEITKQNGFSQKLKNFEKRFMVDQDKCGDKSNRNESIYLRAKCWYNLLFGHNVSLWALSGTSSSSHLLDLWVSPANILKPKSNLWYWTSW